MCNVKMVSHPVGRIVAGSSPVLTTISCLIPGSRVTTIGEFGMSREWGRKRRETYNGGVPKTNETRHRGDLMFDANLHLF